MQKRLTKPDNVGHTDNDDNTDDDGVFNDDADVSKIDDNIDDGESDGYAAVISRKTTTYRWLDQR